MPYPNILVAIVCTHKKILPPLSLDHKYISLRPRAGPKDVQRVPMHSVPYLIAQAIKKIGR